MEEKKHNFHNEKFNLKLDIFKVKNSVAHEKSSLHSIFKRIRTENTALPKDERDGVLYQIITKDSKREKKDILNFSGIIFVDIDGVKGEIGSQEKKDNSNKIKALLKEEFPSLIAAWLSARNNVHGLFLIPVCENEEEFIRRWEALNISLSKLTDSFIQDSHLYDKKTGEYKGVLDEATSRYNQISFIGFDPDIVGNNNPIAFTGIAEKKKPVVKKLPVPFYRNFNPDNDTRVARAKDKIMSELTTLGSSGHVTNVRLAFYWGKRAYERGLAYGDALEWYLKAITHSDYLMNHSTDKHKGSVRTAEQMFKIGYC